MSRLSPGWIGAFLFLGSAAASPEEPKPEYRAVWCHPEALFPADSAEGKAAVRRFVDRMADARFNLILPWIRSEYVAALTEERYRAAVPVAAWDPLGELIAAARDRGIAVQAWYSFTHYKSPESPEFDPKLGGDPAWAARRIDEKIPDPATGRIAPRRMADLCVLHPGAREWELKLIDGLLDRHPLLAGIHIEEPGYGYGGNCVCEACLALFKAVHGREPAPEEVDGPQAEDLKCVGTTDFHRRLRERMLKRDPKLILSVNGGPRWKTDRNLGRDWRRWAEEGWVDDFEGQVYTSSPEGFRKLARTLIGDLGTSCPVVLGIGVKWSSGANTAETVLKEIGIARECGARGVALFSGTDLTDELLAALKAGPFQEPAPLPRPER